MVRWDDSQTDSRKKHRALGGRGTAARGGRLSPADGIPQPAPAAYINEANVDDTPPGLDAAKRQFQSPDAAVAFGPMAWSLTPEGRKPRRQELPPEANLCQYCSAKCCRYLAIQIDEPTTPRQFDYLVWFLLHERVCVFRERGRWFVLFLTPCTKLLADGRCGIYPTRPRICRAYSTKRCEYEDDWVYDRIFETPEQVREFAEVMLAPPRRVIRTRPPRESRQSATLTCVTPGEKTAAVSPVD